MTKLFVPQFCTMSVLDFKGKVNDPQLLTSSLFLCCPHYYCSFITDACEECFQEKKDAEHKALSDFKSAVVYVRKMSDKDIQIINSQFSSSQLSLGSSQEYPEKDPDFMQVGVKQLFTIN